MGVDIKDGDGHGGDDRPEEQTDHTEMNQPGEGGQHRNQGMIGHRQIIRATADGAGDFLNQHRAHNIIDNKTVHESPEEHHHPGAT